jgi:hypothetical protein
VFNEGPNNCVILIVDVKLTRTPLISRPTVYVFTGEPKKVLEKAKEYEEMYLAEDKIGHRVKTRLIYSKEGETPINILGIKVE